MATMATTALALGDVRAAAALALEATGPDDPPVFADYVEAVVPPALMLLWDDPWLEPGYGGRAVMGSCVWSARLMVFCVSGPYEPGPGVNALEQLVAHVIGRMSADTAYTWPPANVLAPRRYSTNDGVPYFGASVIYQVPVAI